MSGFDANIDITFNRHGGNSNSSAAFDRRKDKNEDDRERIMRIIENSSQGITSKELQPFLAKRDQLLRPLNEFSGRLSELQREGRIEQLGRRAGCGIWVPVQKQRGLF